MSLPPRWQWKLDRWREQVAAFFHGQPQEQRPRLCPNCKTLVGSTATKCHECGTSMTFSLAAASRGLAGLIPSENPVTYVILMVNAALFLVSLMATIRLQGGFSLLGGIDMETLYRLGARESRAIFYGQVWRLVVPIFLHGSVMHIGMNTWVLMDLGPQLEEVYGSARFFFLYISTGIFSFIVSTAWNIYWYQGFGIAIGASGALMGLIGLMFAITTRRGGIVMQMLRKQLIQWLIFIGVVGFALRGTDNAAHLGGLAAGYALGKIFVDRQPVDADERKRAYTLGWLAAVVVLGSFGAMLAQYFRGT